MTSACAHHFGIGAHTPYVHPELGNHLSCVYPPNRHFSSRCFSDSDSLHSMLAGRAPRNSPLPKAVSADYGSGIGATKPVKHPGIQFAPMGFNM